MAASARMDAMRRTVVVDKATLRCSLCSQTLTRPVYQCNAGHLACRSCGVELPDNACRPCRDRRVDSAFARCPGLDVFFGDLRVRCPYERHGCDSRVPYFRRDDHRSACELAPSLCPEPGCGFAGVPPRLAAHLAAVHSWPVHRIPRYGVVHALRVPGSGPDRLLVVEEDDDGGGARGVFVLSVRARGAGSAVSVACVRANADAGPRYRCVLWAQGPAPRGAPGRRRLRMETDVQAMGEEEMWLVVPPVMMIGASREIHLSVLIDKL
ncbi:hypothetical protein ACP70R_030358 [Stipagrostis hirtigluma subsp. patula]